MNTSLQDPDGVFYNLSSIPQLTQDNPKTIPFGAAVSGDYILYFDALLTQNITIHIFLERGVKCLSDKIEEYETAITYRNVTKFSSGYAITPRIFLLSNYYYKIYFEKVSPIALNIEGGQTQMNHSLIDPDGIIFTIFANRTVPGPCNATKYRFGTAAEGDYLFKLTVKTNVEGVNIAYAVVNLGKIADDVDPDTPGFPPGNETYNNTRRGTFISIPMLGIIATFGILGGSALVVIIGVRIVKKKNLIP
jgi:hypothetical protein